MNTANPSMIIRNETDADIGAITEVTMSAFESLQISNHTEQFMQKKAEGILVISFPASVSYLAWIRACAGMTAEMVRRVAPYILPVKYRRPHLQRCP